ncbi:hypothetical protein [Hymenobacter guriensis]|uniref:Uncharacterized protein n=1 Tax=Hymenobacter guriensis TaxID=2793065 RepID=A0ABS0L852_9BACT|nr:hypothetical protein [Hymenobacter guriensis]MBG8556287.1 hypothetical protein [Hymenobacter guriensis]
MAVRLTEGSALAPDAYELGLLLRYLDGSLTLAQVLERLEVREKVRTS